MSEINGAPHGLTRVYFHVIMGYENMHECMELTEVDLYMNQHPLSSSDKVQMCEVLLWSQSIATLQYQTSIP